MEGNNSDTPNSQGSSRKKLVRILVIVGIGIPVLVELLTLLNLINVQFWGSETPEPALTPPAKVQNYRVGDTLFAKYPSPYVIDEMKVDVSTSRWRFEFEVSQPNQEVTTPISLDSLQLRSGKIMQIENGWQADPDERSWGHTWDLPSGDIPKVLYLSSLQPVSADSQQKVHQQVHLSSLPIRYSRDDD